VGELRRELSETQERLDLAERPLAQGQAEWPGAPGAEATQEAARRARLPLRYGAYSSLALAMVYGQYETWWIPPMASR
jgi:hypothetical protein